MTASATAGLLSRPSLHALAESSRLPPVTASAPPSAAREQAISYNRIVKIQGDIKIKLISWFLIVLYLSRCIM